MLLSSQATKQASEPCCQTRQASKSTLVLIKTRQANKRVNIVVGPWSIQRPDDPTTPATCRVWVETRTASGGRRGSPLASAMATTGSAVSARRFAVVAAGNGRIPSASSGGGGCKVSARRRWPGGPAWSGVQAHQGRYPGHGAQELCEGRGGRRGLPVPYSLCGRKATVNINIQDIRTSRYSSVTQLEYPLAIFYIAPSPPRPTSLSVCLSVCLSLSLSFCVIVFIDICYCAVRVYLYLHVLCYCRRRWCPGVARHMIQSGRGGGIQFKFKKL